MLVLASHFTIIIIKYVLFWISRMPTVFNSLTTIISSGIASIQEDNINKIGNWVNGCECTKDILGSFGCSNSRRTNTIILHFIPRGNMSNSRWKVTVSCSLILPLMAIIWADESCTRWVQSSCSEMRRDRIVQSLCAWVT